MSEDTIEDIDDKTEGYLEFSLPYGWKKVGCKRKSGVSKDIWDFHVLSPQGKKLRSNNDIFKYLEANPDVKCDQSVTNTSRKPEVLGDLPNVSDLITKNFISSKKYPLKKSSGTISESTTLENQETKNSEASLNYKCMSPEETVENLNMSEEITFDLSEKGKNDLLKQISCIKNPIWHEEQDNFYANCLVREFLEKCSGDKVVEMLKTVLSVKERMSLMQNEYESFFQNQAEAFENHVMIKNELIGSNDCKIKTEPLYEDEIRTGSLMKSDVPNSFNSVLNENNRPVEENLQNINVARNSDIANTKATENSAIKRLMTNSNLSISIQSGEDTIEDIDVKTEGYLEFSLPYGWKKVGCKRKSGVSKDQWDFHVLSPQGKKLRSNNAIFKYLEANPDVKCDQSVTNTMKVLGNLPTDLIPKNFISSEKYPLNKSSGTISEGTILENQETKNSEASFTYKCMSPEKAKGQNDSGDGKIMLIQEKDDYREYSLPFGWQKIGRRRLNQKDWDFYIISPEGKKFRSTIGVNKYLDMNPEIKCDRNVTNTQLLSDLQVLRKFSAFAKEMLD